MQNTTRLKYTAYLEQLAKLNQVQSVLTSFTVAPSIQQTLENKIQESSEFLQRINVIGVDEKEGSKLGLAISGPAASRTDTSGAARQTRDLSALDKNDYRCEHTNSDTHITYAKLDAWAKFPDFQTRVRNMIVRQQVLDRIMIGFNGRSVAATTNIVTNPLLQDVNKGWLQQYRDNASARVLGEGATADKVLVGAGGDYGNLDAVVFDAVNSLIDPWHRMSNELVAIVSRNLLHDKYFPLINSDEKPSERLAADIIISQKRLGGLPAVALPFFPDGSILITAYSNLSLYWQVGARRRYVREAPERNRIENYESSNDAYVVEDYGFGCVVENIELVTNDGPAPDPEDPEET